MAEETERTTAQLCLAWLLARGVTGAIVGARTVPEAIELAEAGLRPADAGTLQRMNELIALSFET